MKIKNAAPSFNEAQNNTYEYINWLEATGRLTIEEHSKLENLVRDLETAALHFGVSELQ